MDESLMSSETAAAVKAREAELLDGLFRVNVNDARPTSDNQKLIMLAAKVASTF